MKGVIRKVTGFTIAGLSGALALLCLDLLFTTGDWQWLFDAFGCAVFTAGVVALTIGHMAWKEFCEDVLVTFLLYW